MSDVVLIQSYDCDAQAPAFWCKFICQIVNLRSTWTTCNETDGTS